MIDAGILAQEIKELGKKNKGKHPVVTVATRRFRRENINIQLSTEQRSLIANLKYFSKPEIKNKISRSLKMFYKPLKTMKVCENCGKEVHKHKSKIKAHSFCNRKCFFEWRYR
jgi:rRNA maturation endonuclease Nob1